jgi:hypothetical protein
MRLHADFGDTKMHLTGCNHPVRARGAPKKDGTIYDPQAQSRCTQEGRKGGGG